MIFSHQNNSLLCLWLLSCYHNCFVTSIIHSNVESRYDSNASNQKRDSSETHSELINHHPLIASINAWTKSYLREFNQFLISNFPHFQNAIWTQCFEFKHHHIPSTLPCLVQHQCVEVQSLPAQPQRHLRYHAVHNELRRGKLADRAQQLPKNSRKAAISECQPSDSPTAISINAQVILSFLLKVKRLTMGILRLNDDSRPLVHNKSSSITSSDSIQTISDGYVNEAICDSEKLISTRFGDSCKQAFNHQTFQMHYPLSSINNAIPLTTLKRSTSQTSSNIITTSATVHASEKSSNLNSCYNDTSGDYNETNFCDFDYKRSFSTAPSSPTNGPSAIPPILPLRNDALSLTEQNDLKGAPWFQAGLPREISLEILSRQNPGAFLVRQSESKMGCFALSLRVPPPAPKVAHYLIMRTQRGFKIKVSLRDVARNFPGIWAWI